MSRPGSQEFEYPPVFRARTDGQRESLGGLGFSTPYNNQDRRHLPTSTVQLPRDFGYGIDNNMSSGPNRNNASTTQMSAPATFSSFNHNLHRASSSPSNVISTHPATPIYHSTSSIDARETVSRHPPQLQPPSTATATNPLPLLPVSNSNTSRSTLWWGDLELWMDEEYARQVCTLMGWDPVNIKVPHPASDQAAGQQSANNPGYCFLTFPSHAHAAAVLAQINNAGKAVTMPNSNRPFVLNWASSVPASVAGTSPSPSYASGPVTYASPPSQQAQFQKEYSIFVGDLAPETSNSDLVAVFRNPVLGLRNDREPKYIRPFLSCKSAKIMLDPVSGVSRGYGFVRFTDEADQQRALIEMHGLYCLSRPMRISPATAKHKGPAGVPSNPSPFDVAQPLHGLSIQEQNAQPLTVALPLPPQTTSVSAPIAATTSNHSINSNGATASTSSSSMGNSNSSNSISSNTGSNSSMTSAFGSATSSEEAMSLQHNALAQFAKQYSGNDMGLPGSVGSSFANEAQLRQVIQAQQNDPAPRFVVQEEHWRHQAQARAILGNLIGPNGEQLTSTDPYNTTVFVGGLSPLISEETLRTFFAPFGDIHYVKVPVGKHCGFVQFVRKADAERAIEKMQGFPIGGSKIRLSWGRSQYKAAQAAAQAAQAALQAQYSTGQSGSLTQDQALALLQKFALQGYRPEPPLSGLPAQLPEAGESDHSGVNYASMVASGGVSLGLPREDSGSPYEPYPSYLPRPDVHRTLSNFSPFSPDPNLALPETQRRDSNAYLNYYAVQSQELKQGASNGLSSGSKISPSSSRPSSTPRYGWSIDHSDIPLALTRQAGRTEAPISRPSSGPSSAETGRQEFDPMHDLNNTLASLEIDRPWKTNEANAPNGLSGQFHLTPNGSP